MFYFQRSQPNKGKLFYAMKNNSILNNNSEKGGDFISSKLT